MDTSRKHSHTQGSGSIAEDRAERFYESEDQGICSETVSSNNVRSMPIKISQALLTICELNIDDTNDCDKLVRDKFIWPQTYTLNGRQLGKAVNRMCCFPSGGAY